MAVHSKHVRPIMETQSIAAPVGEATFLEITAQQLERLGGRYGTCAKTWPESLNLTNSISKWSYTLEACLRICMTVKMAKACGCIDSYDYDFSSDPTVERFPKICSPTNASDVACRNEVYEAYDNGSSTCPCEIPCAITDYYYTPSRICFFVL